MVARGPVQGPLCRCGCPSQTWGRRHLRWKLTPESFPRTRLSCPASSPLCVSGRDRSYQNLIVALPHPPTRPLLLPEGQQPSARESQRPWPPIQKLLALQTFPKSPNCPDSLRFDGHSEAPRGTRESVRCLTRRHLPSLKGGSRGFCKNGAMGLTASTQEFK